MLFIVYLSANSKVIYYFCVVGEKEINFTVNSLVILRASKCWKDPLMYSPYKEIAIREAWKKMSGFKVVQLNSSKNWSAAEPVWPQKNLNGLKG